MSDEAFSLLRDLLRITSALLLAPPTPALVEALTDPEVRAVVDATVGAGAFPTLDGTTFSDGLRDEFFALLAVPGVRYVAPFESVWCDVREVDGVRVAGLFHGESAGAVARVYARHGYALTLREQPDHLGCELAFLATLGERAAAADFAREHPGRFVGRVAARVGGDPEARFYAAVLSLAAVLVSRVAG